VAIVCSGLFHNGLPRGKVSLGDLDAACFSPANPYVSEIRGQQICEALERGLHPSITKVRPHGFRGSPVGIPQISGLLVEFDPNGADGERVKRVFVQGQPLYADHTYRVAHTDAETLPDVGYIQLEEGQPNEFEVPTIVREVIEDYIRQRSPLPAPPGGRWREVSSMNHA
jgi:5'-nucleotidase